MGTGIASGHGSTLSWRLMVTCVATHRERAELVHIAGVIGRIREMGNSSLGRSGRDGTVLLQKLCGALKRADRHARGRHA